MLLPDVLLVAMVELVVDAAATVPVVLEEPLVELAEAVDDEQLPAALRESGTVTPAVSQICWAYLIADV